MIAIIDYGMGNLGSVRNALLALKQECLATRDPREVSSATHIILPGVGAFGEAMHNLRALKLLETLQEAVIGHQTPFLGICLGMQLLADRGLEHGEHTGLGWIPGCVERMAPGDSRYRIPHIGWNSVKRDRVSPIFEGIEVSADFYFVHSFVMNPAEPEHLVAMSDHGGTFCAAVQRDHIFGVQFHPEKSHKAGLALLRNFCRIEGAAC